MTALRLVCLSDTHDRHDRLEVPDGDVLLHAGDFIGRGTEEQVAAFGGFLARLPHAEKVVVAGNHDFLFQRQPERARELLGAVTYLQDDGARVAGLSVWGWPWQPWFHDWAFNLPRRVALGDARAAVGRTRPDGPARRRPRAPAPSAPPSGESVGCEELALARRRIRPRLHLFGHIHEAYGTQRDGGILSVNACQCDLRYRPVQAPVVVDWDGEELQLVE